MLLLVCMCMLPMVDCVVVYHIWVVIRFTVTVVVAICIRVVVVVRVVVAVFTVIRVIRYTIAAHTSSIAVGTGDMLSRYTWCHDCYPSFLFVSLLVLLLLVL